MSRLLVPLTLLVLLGSPALAQAGTGSVGSFTAGRSDSTYHYVSYVAAPGERNEVTASLRHDGSDVVGVLTDTAGVHAGAGCVQESARTLSCPLSHVSSTPFAYAAPEAFRIDLGDGDDRAVVAQPPGLAAVIDGGPGNDTLIGGPGGRDDPGDTGLRGGNVLRGGPGNDVLIGGPNDDLFDESGPSADGSDVIRGDGGGDTVTYQGRLHAVHVDLRGNRHAGQRGENDRISGVQSAVGGNGPDDLRGNRLPNDLIGGPGADVLVGGDGNDTLDGQGGASFEPPSYLDGLGPSPSPAQPVAPPRPAVDRLYGGAGDDHLNGGPGADRVDGGPGEDQIVSYSRATTVDARDRSHDFVFCVHGPSRTLLDGLDFSDVGCGHPQRIGLPRLTMLNNDDMALTGGAFAQLELGCPIDVPRRCNGTATITRGRDVLLDARVSVAHGFQSVVPPLTATGKRYLSRGSVAGVLTLVTVSRGGRRAVYRHRIVLVR